jgi:hypothetical protein
MEIIRHENKCLVKSTRADSFVEAEVMDFDYCKKMTVVIQKTIKVPMVWNGKTYEGRAAGMDFLSDGPQVSKTQTSIRG